MKRKEMIISIEAGNIINTAGEMPLITTFTMTTNLGTEISLDVDQLDNYRLGMTIEVSIE